MYGIKNCDTIKKARTWLEDRGVAYVFHYYNAVGIDEPRLRGWVEKLGWETVLNRAGTTFRKLPEADRADLNADKAIALMIAQPSMIKRPMLEHEGALLAGFKPDAYAAVFKA
ncbi:ArsC family reductase [Sphingobium boeckii]|nr:ArsC family reductase [Sphingobium boeckii]